MNEFQIFQFELNQVNNSYCPQAGADICWYFKMFLLGCQNVYFIHSNGLSGNVLDKLNNLSDKGKFHLHINPGGAFDVSIIKLVFRTLPLLSQFESICIGF